jgi:hypothetical protein
MNLSEAYQNVYSSQEVDEAVKGQDSEMRKAAAAERAAERKEHGGAAPKIPGKQGPSAGTSYADYQKLSIAKHDKLTKKNKNVVGLVTREELEATGLFTADEISGILEAASNFDEMSEDAKYDRNRKRAAQRAAERNAARAAGKTGVVPGVGYVSPRKERETYVDSAGTTRHKSGAKMP